MRERMQWSDAEAVVRAYRAEHGVTTEVDVATLARALGTNVSEVRRLAGQKRRFTDRSGLLSAAIALAVLAATVLAAGPSLLTRNPLLASLAPRTTEFAPMPVVATGTRIFIKAGPDGRVHILDSDEAPVRWIAPPDEESL